MLACVGVVVEGALDTVGCSVAQRRVLQTKSAAMAMILQVNESKGADVMHISRVIRTKYSSVDGTSLDLDLDTGISTGVYSPSEPTS